MLTSKYEQCHRTGTAYLNPAFKQQLRIFQRRISLPSRLLSLGQQQLFLLGAQMQTRGTRGLPKILFLPSKELDRDKTRSAVPQRVKHCLFC